MPLLHPTERVPAWCLVRFSVRFIWATDLIKVTLQLSDQSHELVQASWKAVGARSA